MKRDAQVGILYVDGAEESPGQKRPDHINALHNEPPIFVWSCSAVLGLVHIRALRMPLLLQHGIRTALV